MIVLAFIPKGKLAHGIFGQIKGDASAFPSFSVFPQLTRPVNILCMGVDSNGPGTDRFSGTRSDTMILVNVNPFTKKVSVISIPRDSRVEIARGHGINKINAAHAIGGPELAVETVSQTFSIPVDHYVVIDCEGLKKAFEILGPVQVMVEKPMQYHDHTAHLDVDLSPGLQTLDPAQAEEYVRFRHDARGDIGRIERQQWFLRQVSQKMRDPMVLFKLPQLIAVSQDYVKTDLSTEDMAALAAFAKDVQKSQVVTATLPGDAQMIDGGSYWVPNMQACRVVLDRLLNTNVADGNTNPFESVAHAVESSASSDNQAKPLKVALKYPKGAEQTADSFEQKLIAGGCKVRYKWQVDLADCQHEEIVENTARTNDQSRQALKKCLPQLSDWPINLAPDSTIGVDFTLVITPTTAATADHTAMRPFMIR